MEKQKILVLNNIKYSRYSFSDYKYRAKISARTETDEHLIDIYTTNTSKKDTEKILLGRTTEKIVSLSIINWTSREQDELSNKLIKDLL